MPMSFKDAFYDKYATTHLAHRKSEATLDSFRAKSLTWDTTFGPLLPTDRSARIIDVGCGNGRLVWWLQHIGYDDAEGIDVSGEQVEIARGLGVANVQKADLRAYLGGQPAAYDAIIMRDVLEHFTRPDIV